MAAKLSAGHTLEGKQAIPVDVGLQARRLYRLGE
jgi:hypothetical protein